MKSAFNQQIVFVAQSRPTKRAPDAGDSAQISSIFPRLIIFLVGRLRRPRPSAGNAHRSAASAKKQHYKNIHIKSRKNVCHHQMLTVQD